MGLDALGRRNRSRPPCKRAAPTPCRPDLVFASASARGAQSTAVARSAVQTSKPFMPGMTTSSTMQSAGCSRNWPQQLLGPSGGGEYPEACAISNALCTNSRAPGSSSTTRDTLGGAWGRPPRRWPGRGSWRVRFAVAVSGLCSSCCFCPILPLWLPVRLVSVLCISAAQKS